MSTALPPVFSFLSPFTDSRPPIRPSRISSAVPAISSLALSACHSEFGGIGNTSTPLWMGLTGLVVCGLFGLNRYHHWYDEQQGRKLIISFLANGRALRAMDMMKESKGELRASSIYVMLARMETEGLVESWDAQPSTHDWQISRARENRLYRLKCR